MFSEASYMFAGTLTENRMTVVEGWFSGKKYNTPPSKEALPPNVAQIIIDNICLNSKAFYIDEPGKKTVFVGNRTECALLMLCERDFKVPYDNIRKANESSVPHVRCCSYHSSALYMLRLSCQMVHAHVSAGTCILCSSSKFYSFGC
jgi:magnesium-transporting ATPase (P-type)